ncbi:MAG: SPOR domain-containing protein [Pseudomonadota bacterium]
MHQEFDPRDLEPALPTREERPVRSKVAPIMIALVALAGFGGVVWYAYDQGVRQTATPGVTPLIKADTGPTKVRPEQPGGMEVPHQDKLVLNSLPDPDKTGAPPVERLLPPAETPLPRPTATAPMPAPIPGTMAAPLLPPKIGPAPTPAPTATAAPMPATSVPVMPAPAAPPPSQVAAVPATPAPAAQSAPRQIDKPQTAAVPKPAPASAPAAASTSAGSASGTGYRVRLVSVKSQDQTAQEWARLQHAYPQLAPLHMSVTRVELGEKGVWYRIHAGPLADAAAASQLCDAINAKDKSQGCLVVKP